MNIGGCPQGSLLLGEGPASKLPEPVSHSATQLPAGAGAAASGTSAVGERDGNHNLHSDRVPHVLILQPSFAAQLCLFHLLVILVP